MVHGQEDKVVSPMGSQILAKRINAPEITLKMVRGAAHTLPWDPTTAEMNQIAKEWLTAVD